MHKQCVTTQLKPKFELKVLKISLKLTNINQSKKVDNVFKHPVKTATTSSLTLLEFDNQSHLNVSF